MGNCSGKLNKLWFKRRELEVKLRIYYKRNRV